MATEINIFLNPDCRVTFGISGVTIDLIELYIGIKKFYRPKFMPLSKGYKHEERLQKSLWLHLSTFPTWFDEKKTAPAKANSQR